MGGGLETQELATQGAEVDVEGPRGRRAVGEGTGEEGVVAGDRFIWVVRFLLGCRGGIFGGGGG